MVSSNPMILPMVLFTLMTPNSYPMGHYKYNHAFMSKNGQRWFKTSF